MTAVRTGLGWDNHRIADGRTLILGGVHIPCEFGLDGLSDADILLHALTDALRGALALGGSRSSEPCCSAAPPPTPSSPPSPSSSVCSSGSASSAR